MAKKSKNTSIVKYGDLTEEEADEQQEQSKKDAGGNIFMKLKEGKNKVRFIPPPEGKKWVRVTYKHAMDIPGVGSRQIVCPNMEAGKKCIICKLEKTLMAKGTEIDEEKAKKIRAKRKLLANVIDRKQPSAGPKILEFGTMIEDQILDMRKRPNDDEDNPGGNPVHPVKGIDTLIIREGLKRNTKYTVVAGNKGKILPLSEDAKEMNEWITTQHNLERWVKVYSEEDMKKVLRGEEPDGDDDEKPRRASKSVDDEIDEVDDEEIEIDDE